MSATLHFDAVITANRSLSKRGFRVLIGVFIALNLVVGTFFWAIGGMFVPVFLGLDVLGLTVAFAANNRRALQTERVRVCAAEVRVLHEQGARSRLVWRSPTAFTRVSVEGADDEARVCLQLSGRRRVIGRALSPKERVALGGALQDAIKAARAERY